MAGFETPFQTARAELRAIGIDLSVHPGAYCVNFTGAGDATAYFSDDLADAIEHGRAMAAAIVTSPALPAAKPIRRRRPRRMTPKAHNRRLRKQHMRRLRAKARRQHADRHDDKA